MKNPKISLITPLIVDFRMPFFSLLDKYYNITYLITRTSKLNTQSTKGTKKLTYKNFKYCNIWRGLISFSTLKDLIFMILLLVMIHIHLNQSLVVILQN